MEEEFYSIIWNEYQYDVSLAEELRGKPVETRHDELEEFPTLHFPGFGVLKIVFLPEDMYGEDTE